MRGCSRFWAASLVVAMLGPFGGGIAEAQVRPEKAAADTRARELFQEGDVQYAEGRYEEALAKFQEAYDLSGRPQLLFNISNALERLGRLVEAADALEKYLASKQARDRAIVQKRLSNLKKRVAEQEEEEVKRAALEALRKGEAEERAASSPEPSPGEPDRPDRPEPARPAESPAPVLPYVLLGTGAAAVVTGVVFGILTLNARSDADAGCADTPSGRLCSRQAEAAIDRDRTFSLVTDVSLASGLVLGAIGVYLLLKPREAADSARVTVPVRVVGRPGGGGVDLGFSF
jgi:tetratricopeptide (TPR) repeat protein